MAKTKNTPAYVKKAIERLEKNTPNGEQIAFINDKEAAQLKAMGGSGEEIVEGVRSYQNFLDELSSVDRARALGQIPVEDQGSSANRPGSAANTARLRARANDNRRRAGLAPLTEEQFNAIPGSRTFAASQQQQQEEPADRGPSPMDSDDFNERFPTGQLTGAEIQRLIEDGTLSEEQVQTLIGIINYQKIN